MQWKVTARKGWRHWVTPRSGRTAARHRWFLFPHSFSSELVEALAREWTLGRDDRLLDPFAGSGTSLLSARTLGISCDGFDISPLSVLACNGKVRTYSKATMQAHWETLKRGLRKNVPETRNRNYPALVRRALPEGRLEALDRIWMTTESMTWTNAEREFFQLAILAILPRFSHALANGGWLRWTKQGLEAQRAVTILGEQVEQMLADLDEEKRPLGGSWTARVADARALPVQDSEYSAVITSPPYPNRHDYTRVFGVELMFAFQNWEENRLLRYQSFHSHPEARPERREVDDYHPPERLSDVVEKCIDVRVKRMLEGYFLDMYLSLCEVARACRTGGRVAYVVGNARYYGVELLVDEFTAEVGERAGLRCDEIRAVRWRGNSAQQMGKYGRVAARESVVIFTKP